MESEQTNVPEVQLDRFRAYFAAIAAFGRRGVAADGNRCVGPVFGTRSSKNSSITGNIRRGRRANGNGKEEVAGNLRGPNEGKLYGSWHLLTCTHRCVRVGILLVL